MIEQLPRQRVLNFLEAFYGGDRAAALKCCDDDIESRSICRWNCFRISARGAARKPSPN